MEVQSPIAMRSVAATRDADRVDVRGLLHAIAGRKLLILGFTIGLAVLFFGASQLLPPSYHAYSKVMLDPRNVQIAPSEEVVSNLDLSDPVILSEISVMQSNVLLGALIDDLGLERLEKHFFGETRPEADAESRQAAVTEAIRDDLKILRDGNSYVVTISFDGRDRALVAEIANGIASAYISMQIAQRRDSVRQATSWIEEQVADARAEVERAETAVAEYRARSLAIDGSSYETTNQQLANLNAQLVVARSDRVAAEAQFDQLESILAEQGAEGLAKAVTSPLLERLAEDRSALQREDDEWARSFGAGHPQRVRLAEKISSVDAELAAEAKRVIDLHRNAVEVARLRETSLTDSIRDLENRLTGISENTLALRQQEREADAARQNYQALLARLSATTGQDKLQRPDARIIERAAIPESPAFPRPKLLGAFGGMFGLTLGIVTALFSEMTRTTFRSRRELEAETGIKVLTALPRVRGGNTKEIITSLSRNSNTLFGERIRQLRTFLLMRNGTYSKRVILVASSQPDEGKSLTALALAEMVVLAGKSVILVDADLRRSRLAEDFGWKPEFDFADFILDRCDLADAIHTDDELGINVLAAKAPCPEAADELNAGWLLPMVAELQRAYDVVVIDSPPLLKVADGLVLARVADSIIYVVRWDSTRHSAVAEGLDALSEMRLGVTGLILNQVDPKLAEKAYGEGYATYQK